jgi:hypothetical protein
MWIYQKQWSKLFSFKWLAALALSLIFVAPELFALHSQFGQHTTGTESGSPVSSFKFFFWDSQFGRFFNTGPIQNHNGHPFYFVLVFIWAFLPWTLVFFRAMYGHFRAYSHAMPSERSALIFLSSMFICTFLMFSATKFQLDYYIDIILPFAAILCARFINNSSLGKKLFTTQMGLIGLLAFLAIALSIYVMNTTLLATIVLGMIGLLYYIFRTKGESFNFRSTLYSVLAIDLLYLFLTLLTALAFTQYSIPHNAVKLLGKHSDLPIYVYQMPEVARELVLYTDAPCYEVETVESLNGIKGNFNLIARHEQTNPILLHPISVKQIAEMDLVVHKTGTFNKLLKLAQGTGPLEKIDFLEYAAQ